MKNQNVKIIIIIVTMALVAMIAGAGMMYAFQNRKQENHTVTMINLYLDSTGSHIESNAVATVKHGEKIILESPKSIDGYNFILYYGVKTISGNKLDLSVGYQITDQYLRVTDDMVVYLIYQDADMQENIQNSTQGVLSKL